MKSQYLFLLGVVALLAASSAAVVTFVHKPNGDTGGGDGENVDNIENIEEYIENFEEYYPLYSAWPSYVSISADGSYIAAVYSELGDVLLFGREDDTPLLGSNVGDILESVSVSENGEFIAVGGRHNLYLFNKDNATPVWSANVDSSDFVQISNNGSYIAALNGDLHIFSRENNTPLWSLESVTTFAMSSDGNYLAAGTNDNKLHLLRSADGVAVWSFSFDEGLLDVDISSDGGYITISGKNGNLYLFGQTDNVPLWTYQVGTWSYPAISADGNYVAVVFVTEAYEGKVHLFSRADNIPLWTASCPWPEQVTISSNGDYIAVGGVRYLGPTLFDTSKEELQLFSSSDNTPLWTYEFPISVKSVSMSADGQYVAVGTVGLPGPYIATSIYLFSKDNNQPLWVYYHGLQPYLTT